MLSVVHSLPGRTRFHLKSSFSPTMIEYFIRLLPCVSSVTYTQETGNVLIHHDPTLSLHTLKKSLRRLCVKKKEEQIRPFSWKKLIPVAACAALFLANCYIQRRQFSSVVKNIGHWAAVITSVSTSLGVIKDGIMSLKNRKANANTLTAASIFASLYIGNPGSALVITMMSTISEWLTEYTSEKTKEYIHSVLELDTTYAWRVNEQGIEEKVAIDQVQVGDTVVVFTGEKIPIDGIVSQGHGIVDESSITGEYMPKEIGEAQQVYGGSILQNGQLIVLVEKVGDDTATSRIIKLLEEAQEKRAPIQNTADNLAEKMVPFSFGLAFLTFFLTRNVNRAMNMLVIDFICGIKLSTATALYASIGKAANKGAVVKGSNHIEEMARLETIILDKTGTITEGTPLVQQVISCEGYKQEEVIRLAATAEKNSSHPIADAIVRLAGEWKVEIPARDENSKVDTIIGKGIRTFLHGKQVVVGSLRFMKELKINMDHFVQKLEKDESVIYVAYDNTLVGVISIFDRIRSGMHRAVHELRHQGIHDIIMLTGDKRTVARDMARRLRLNWYHAEVLPEDKAKYVKQYRRNSTVMMVGDGINDAPALAHANIGVTMGRKRTDIACEASDIIITSDNPKVLPELVGLSKKTMNIIKQNFIATFLINGGAILLGALGAISPITGAAIHNAATIGVVLNSARILWIGGERCETQILHPA
ncbi:cation-translocating P-type ATPase [Peribacillus simplex]|uniref:heavy metal translocating P-type ATPase n=1 Tax=Peribacillus simplex TaxID=1478 RepID=UPI00203D492F|nr:cation-translocating P-type ATPase [Peribacillus simplex]MCM3676652.1 cation-translocating P-type ATPase [Peribacillus simplex]